MKNVHTLNANQTAMTATAKAVTADDLIEMLSRYPSRDLALLLVEVARAKYNCRAVDMLDAYQKKILPLAVHGNKPTRERIYRLRTICGLLATNYESVRYE